jgi:UDP-glucuronate 4-epimerase
VYGPWGRPDMSLALFTRAILQGIPIDVFNRGEMERDFTYVDDIAEGVVRVLDVVPTPDESVDMLRPDPAVSYAPYRLYNIGNNRPVQLTAFIETLERALGRSAIKNFVPMQPGDVPATYADIEELRDAIGFAPSTPLEEGIRRYVAWFREYYEMPA